MKQIYEAARTVNQLLLTVILVLVLVLAMDPRLAGRWQVEADIAYDTIWMVYVADCDCTPSLE